MKECTQYSSKSPKTQNLWLAQSASFVESVGSYWRPPGRGARREGDLPESGLHVAPGGTPCTPGAPPPEQKPEPAYTGRTEVRVLASATARSRIAKSVHLHNQREACETPIHNQDFTTLQKRATCRFTLSLPGLGCRIPVLILLPLERLSLGETRLQLLLNARRRETLGLRWCFFTFRAV